MRRASPGSDVSRKRCTIRMLRPFTIAALTTYITASVKPQATLQPKAMCSVALVP